MSRISMKRLVAIVLIVSMIFTTGGFAALADSISDVAMAAKLSESSNDISHKYYDDLVNESTDIKGANNTSENTDTAGASKNLNEVNDAENINASENNDIEENEDESEDDNQSSTDYADEPEDDNQSSTDDANEPEVDTTTASSDAEEPTTAEAAEEENSKTTTTTTSDETKNENAEATEEETTNELTEPTFDDKEIVASESDAADDNEGQDVINFDNEIDDETDKIDVASTSDTEDVSDETSLELATFSEIDFTNEIIATESEIFLASLSVMYRATKSQIFGDVVLPSYIWFGTYPQDDGSNNYNSG